MLTVLFYIIAIWLLYGFIMNMVNTFRYGDEEFWPKKPAPPAKPPPYIVRKCSKKRS